MKDQISETKHQDTENEDKTIFKTTLIENNSRGSGQENNHWVQKRRKNNQQSSDTVTRTGTCANPEDGKF